ncbi:MAG TPA: response regulator transcription factor [Thermoanaerobaculia bacterium]
MLCLGASPQEREEALRRAANLAGKSSEEGAPARVVVCGNQPIMRSALRLLVDTRPNYQVALDTDVCPTALLITRELNIDAVLLDFDLHDADPERLATLQALLEAAPSVPVLILTTDPDSDACHQAFQMGVRGLVLKSKTLDDLFGAIDRIRRGDIWLEGPALQKLLRQGSKPKQSSETSKIALLTKREREIVETVACGLTNRQVAQQLFISDATVRHHLCTIFEKLGISSRGELIVYAYRHNLADRKSLEAH